MKFGSVASSSSPAASPPSPSQASSYDINNTPNLQLNIGGLCLIFVTPMLGGFLYGFDIGATSFVLSMLLQYTTNENDDTNDTERDDVWWYDMSTLRQGLLVSAVSLGALLGSHLVLMYMSHKIGRRMELRLCAIWYLFGTTLNVLSGTYLRYSTATLGFMVLFVGRLLFGIGVGFVMHGAPTYMAEMSPPFIRGAVVSAKETVTVSGIVVGYAVGNIISINPQQQWTDLYALSFLVALPMFLLTFAIPRSKRWLLHRGLKDEALQSMKFVYQGDGVEEELERLITQLELTTTTTGTTTTTTIPTRMEQHQNNDNNNNINDESNKNENSNNRNGATTSTTTTHASLPSLWNDEYRPAMMASMGLILFQQFSGQPSVLSYVTVLFQEAGWSGNASVITSVLMMCTSITTVTLVDSVGRKRLLFTCCGIMITALMILSSCFWQNEPSHIAFTHSQQWMILIAMFIYIGGYQVGFGPITWCIVSEVFPSEIRGRAIALGVELNYLLNFVVQCTFPIIQDTLGWGPSFGLFAALLLACIVFIRTYVPETKGMTLEEIQLQLQQHVVVMTNNDKKQITSDRMLQPLPTSMTMDSKRSDEEVLRSYVHETSPLLGKDMV